MKKMFAVAVTSFAAAGVLLFGHMDAQAANTAQQGTVVGVSNYKGVNESRTGVTTARPLPLNGDSTAAKPKAKAKPKATTAAKPSAQKKEVQIASSTKVDTFLGFEISRTTGKTTTSVEQPSPTTASVAKAKKDANAAKNMLKPAPQANAPHVVAPKAPSPTAAKDAKVVADALGIAKQQAGKGGPERKINMQVRAYPAGHAPTLKK